MATDASFDQSLDEIAPHVAIPPSPAGTTSTSQTIDFSLVVPSTYVDFNCFSGRFFNHLYYKVQEPPKEVIIVVASVPEDVSELHYLKPPPDLDIKVRIILFHSAHNAAQNRNIGSLLAQGQIVSFFDFDDILHPQRFVILRKIFFGNTDTTTTTTTTTTTPEVAGVIHSYVRGNHRDSMNLHFDSIDIDSIEEPTCHLQPKECKFNRKYNSNSTFLAYYHHWNADRDPEPTRWCCNRPRKGLFLANGWGTFRRDVFLRLMYDETLLTGEDGNLNAKFIYDRENFQYWDIVLGFYENNVKRKEICGHDVGALH